MHCSAVYCIHKAVKALALQPSHADHVGAVHESVVRYTQVYMDSINDLLWEEQGSGGARPKLEVRIGAFGSHLPGLVEKQVCLTAFLTALSGRSLLPCWHTVSMAHVWSNTAHFLGSAPNLGLSVIFPGV